jgi:hypothetical protein
LDETGTRLGDWIDHLEVPHIPGLAPRLMAAGFRATPTPTAPGCYRHDDGIFPAIILTSDGSYALHLKVDSVLAVLLALDLTVPIAGEVGAPLRRARISSGDAEVWVVERHGYAGFDLLEHPPERMAAYHKYDELFLTRLRFFEQPIDGFRHTLELIQLAISDLGVDLACERFFAAERAYWQRHNRTAHLQYERQNSLGFGWGNHDHHTYRSSRQYFTHLISIFEALGFNCRERFYPGHNAGWGAQVLEQPVTGIVIFADVDMAPDEIQYDFAHEPFPTDPQRPLGTVGLWCALHGESFLAAGMHHLEATFAFDQARSQLAALGIETMTPFTDFPHLRQCFTTGEQWPVSNTNIDALLQATLITKEQAAVFRAKGAIGSHLEILERNQGFKGFNQLGVDAIIAKTDPRQTHSE